MSVLDIAKKLTSISNSQHIHYQCLSSHLPQSPLLSEDISQHLSAAMTSVHVVYVALQDLYVNFRSIIVPEAIKTLSRGDASVAASIGALDQLVEETRRPLDTLMAQLEVQLRNTTIGNEVRQGYNSCFMKSLKCFSLCVNMFLFVEILKPLLLCRSENKVPWVSWAPTF